MSFFNKVKGLTDKFQDTQLESVKVSLTHQKNKIGKLGNIFNRNHRHDEEHEIECDNKREAIAAENRFHSFFPERDGNLVKWYVDGRDYFWAVSEALEQARETIYIADWWLSPELFLRRPPSDNQEWRLDQILKRKAQAGVKIYISVYREVEAALACNSRHTKDALQNLCPEGTPGYGNIRVMRHPDHNVFENAADMTLYWAHHEKFIVIDYQMAFIGGLDLCFGRWDLHNHPLSDAYPGQVEKEVWPGQDFNNNRVMDFKNVNDWKQNELSKTEYGRMPWHDVSMGLIGPCVYDIAEHFVLRWNFVKRDKYKRDDRYDWLTLAGREGKDQEDLVGVQRPTHPVGEYVHHPVNPNLTWERLVGPNPHGTVKAQIVRSSADWSSGILTDHSIQNAYCELIAKAEHFIYIENQFFITATGDQQSPIHNHVGRSLVDAVVRAAKEQRPFRVIVLIPAVPGFAGDLREDAAAGTRAIMDYQYKSICRGEHSIFEQIRAQDVDPAQYIFFFNLRSYDRLKRTPTVLETEEYSGVKYAEVQRGQAEKVMSEGIHALDYADTNTSQRVKAKHEATAKASSLWGSMKSRKDDKSTSSDSSKDATTVDDQDAQDAIQKAGKFEDALHEKIRARGPEQEAEFYRVAPTVAHHALQGTGPLTDEPWEQGADSNSEIDNWIQEELYIHSKLMIVDDRYVLCGSSNLNDRSQVGSHDSELSIVLEDTNRVQSTMAGKPYEVSLLATTLRRQLFREHMGLLGPQTLDGSQDPMAQPPHVDTLHAAADHDEAYRFVEDPLGEAMWAQWQEQATNNTNVFRHVFHADPDDHVKTFDDYVRYLPPKGVKAGHVFDQFMPAEDVRQKLDQIRGHLVWMPMAYLQDSEMAERGLQINQFTESVFT